MTAENLQQIPCGTAGMVMADWCPACKFVHLATESGDMWERALLGHKPSDEWIKAWHGYMTASVPDE